MKPGIQSLLLSMGRAACYALCIIKHAEESQGKHFMDGMVVDMLMAGVEKKLLFLADHSHPDNWLVSGPDRTTDTAGAYLSMLTGKRWTCMRRATGYQLKDNERMTERWERRVTDGRLSHFINPAYPARQSYFDPLINSQTVKFGSVASLRVFTDET